MGFVIAPDRKPYECWKSKEDKEAIIKWLSAHGPREWHLAADIWNWDAGYDTLALIMEQPECDRATCQLIFARSEVSHYLTEKSQQFVRAKSKPDGIFAMIQDMLARWRAGYYSVGEIGLHDDDLRGWANSVLRYQLAVIDLHNRDPELMLPKDFMFLAYGDRVDRDYYWKRKLIPPELEP